MSISQTTNNGAVLPNTTNGLTITPEQVKNVYNGLKSAEEYKRRFQECYEVSLSLNQIIEQNVADLEESVMLIDSLNLQIANKHAQLVMKEVEIAKIQTKKTVWYKSPWIWGSAGLIAGILIAK